MNQPVRQVSMPELINDVHLYMSFKKKHNLYNFLYRITLGLFFYKRTMYYYNQYTKYLYKIEHKYKRIINRDLVILPTLNEVPEAYVPSYNPIPSAPPANSLTI